MANVTVGRDPESYMDPPKISSGGGGLNPIAAFLDLLGIGKPVAREPAGGTEDESTPTEADSAAAMPVLTQAESAFQPIQPLPTDWGLKYLESIKPLTKLELPASNAKK